MADLYDGLLIDNAIWLLSRGLAGVSELTLGSPSFLNRTLKAMSEPYVKVMGKRVDQYRDELRSSHKMVVTADAFYQAVEARYEITNRSPKRAREILSLARPPMSNLWFEILEGDGRQSTGFHIIQQDSNSENPTYRMTFFSYNEDERPYCGTCAAYFTTSLEDPIDQLILPGNTHLTPTENRLNIRKEEAKLKLPESIQKPLYTIEPNIYVTDFLVTNVLADTVKNLLGGVIKDAPFEIVEKVIEHQDVVRDLQASSQKTILIYFLDVITAISLINTVEVNETIKIGRPRKQFVRNKPKHYFDHTLVDLVIPSRIRNVTKWLGQQIKHEYSRRRRHHVRGHWRVYRKSDGTKDRRWIHEHYRGDATLGFVQHDYLVRGNNEPRNTHTLKDREADPT